jgi:hypothetical protein
VDLKAIFASPVYAAAKRPKGGRGEAAFWLPLIALFTGARLEEIAQLYVRDLQQVPNEDLWFFNITDTGEDQRLKVKAKNRRKCLDAGIRLSCQKPGVRVSRPIEHPGRHFKPPICLRPIKRAAEDDKTTLVDGTMNANSATKPGVMPIKNLAKNRPVAVLKPRCTTK